MKASLRHDILLTFLIILCIFMVIGCMGCAIAMPFSADTYSYYRTFFFPDDISYLEDMYQVKFPKGTQFVEFRGNQSDKTGDTDAILRIKLPDSERDKFAGEWFKRNPDILNGRSLNEFFAKDNNLPMSKIYSNHSGDTVLKRFESISDLFVKFMGTLGWFVSIILISITVTLYNRFSKKDINLWVPPE